MSKTFTVPEAARILCLTTTQVYRELQSWPHQGHGSARDLGFTLSDLAEIERMMDAGADEQLERLTRMEAQRAELRASGAL